MSNVKRTCMARRIQRMTAEQFGAFAVRVRMCFTRSCALVTGHSISQERAFYTICLWAKLYTSRPSDQNPTARHNPYPTLMITAYAMILAGIPLVKKCLTCRYRCPVCESSIMIAAANDVSKDLRGEYGLKMTYSYSESHLWAGPWLQKP